jgi:hypothetical protein
MAVVFIGRAGWPVLERTRSSPGFPPDSPSLFRRMALALTRQNFGSPKNPNMNGAQKGMERMTYFLGLQVGSTFRHRTQLREIACAAKAIDCVTFV